MDCKCSGPERVRVAGADSGRRAGARRGDNGPKAGDQTELRSTIAASIAHTRTGPCALPVLCGQARVRHADQSDPSCGVPAESMNLFIPSEGERENERERKNERERTHVRPVESAIKVLLRSASRPDKLLETCCSS